MSKAGSVLTLIGLVLAVWLVARAPGSREPQVDNQPLSHWVDLIVAQPRLHRHLIAKIGAPLTPQLVRRLQNWRDQEDPFYSEFYATLYHRSPADLQQFLPEPISNEQRCLNAIRALAYLGPPAAGAVRTLIQFLSDERFASDAAHALASIGPNAHEAIPDLARALEDQVPWAATALGNMGAAAVDAIPALNRAWTNSTIEGPGWFRREIEKTLARIQCEEDR